MPICIWFLYRHRPWRIREEGTRASFYRPDAVTKNIAVVGLCTLDLPTAPHGTMRGTPASHNEAATSKVELLGTHIGHQPPELTIPCWRTTRLCLVILHVVVAYHNIFLLLYHVCHRLIFSPNFIISATSVLIAILSMIAPVCLML